MIHFIDDIEFTESRTTKGFKYISSIYITAAKMYYILDLFLVFIYNFLLIFHPLIQVHVTNEIIHDSLRTARWFTDHILFTEI